MPDMSSDVRIKKLRGSGGFVMASVTDEEQRKGNLGGPDLFLAPIGRLDSEKISKYFCNTCEKEYEGSPKIEYENPNEEVAENLFLVERGQYLCSVCNAALAEYREFKKPDETVDVGIAKPIEPKPTNEPQRIEPPSMEQPIVEPQSMEQPIVEPQSMEQPIVEPPSMEQPIVEPPSMEQPIVEPPSMEPPVEEPSIPSYDIQSMNEQTSTESSNSSVNSITGMLVYDENARKIGVAKQVGIDSSQSVVLVITKDDGTDITIPWDKIKKVGEIILLGNPETNMAPDGECPDCGFNNKAGSKFCENCGTKI